MNKTSTIISLFPIFFLVACGGSIDHSSQETAQWLPSCVINGNRYSAIETDAGQLIEPNYIESGDGGCICTVNVYNISSNTNAEVVGTGTCDLLK